MTDICTKLSNYFAYKGKNLSNVENDCGFSKNSLRKSFDRGSSIGSDKLMVIMSVYTEISAEWLLRGKGNMLLSDEEKPQQKPIVGEYPYYIFREYEKALKRIDELETRLTLKEKAAV